MVRADPHNCTYDIQYPCKTLQMQDKSIHNTTVKCRSRPNRAIETWLSWPDKKADQCMNSMKGMVEGFDLYQNCRTDKAQDQISRMYWPTFVSSVSLEVAASDVISPSVSNIFSSVWCTSLAMCAPSPHTKMCTFGSFKSLIKLLACTHNYKARSLVYPIWQEGLAMREKLIAWLCDILIYIVRGHGQMQETWIQSWKENCWSTDPNAAIWSM